MARPTREGHHSEAADVAVRRSGVHGRGLFARRDFRKGECIMEYVGHRISKQESEDRTAKQWTRGRVYTFDLNKKWDLDGSPLWNKARWANHSCDPNTESENDRGRHIWLMARRRITAGDEITYDYNFPLEDDLVRCKCGSAKCRGYMVGSQWTGRLRKRLEKDRLAKQRKTRKATARAKAKEKAIHTATRHAVTRVG